MANNNHFDLTLDTLAPSGSITREHININANENLTIVKGDATYMKVWFNTTAVGTKSDSEYPANPEAAATSKMTAFSTAGDYYYHLVLIDSVNNESEVYNTEKIVFDPNAPEASNFHMADPDTGSTTITNNTTGIVVTFDYTDDPDSVGIGISGVVLATLTGDDITTRNITLDPTHSSYSGTIDFVSGVQDGTKTINLVLTDAAGNTSTLISTSITLDTQLDVPVITLETTSGTSLPAYVNYTSINVHLTDAETNINGYKLWMGTDADEPNDFTQIDPPGSVNLNIPTTLTGTDGTKTFHAKVRDTAGSIATATPKSVVLDTTPPDSVRISSDKSIISNVSGNYPAILTLTGTDNLGIASYDLSCGNTSILSGNIDEQHQVLPSSFNLTSANSMVEGSNTLTWTIVDKAGNSSSDTCTVILDTTAPTASIGSLNTWYNDEFDISVTTADANTVSQIWVWTSTTESDTTVPGDCNSMNVSAGVTQVDHNNIAWHNAQSASNYMHVKVVDSVGNAGYADAVVFGFDDVVPATPTIAFSQSAYISTSASANIQYSTDTSGVAYMRVTGDITNPTANDAWEAISSPRPVTLTSGDGSKSIYVQVKDAAGNISALSTAAICELDTTDPTASLVLYEADNQTAKPSVSPVATFTARITITDAPATGGTDSDPRTYYKLWGDFITGGSDEPAEWTVFTPDSGQVYESVTGLSCTSGDGPKTMRLKVKDSAGHTLETIIASFTYDTAAPTVAVSDVDYNIVSKVHELRRTSSGTIEGKYSDECRFLITPNEIIQAWKVCAYTDQTAAEAGSASNTAIPMTAGSVNMSGTTNSDNAISCTIKGADYETALGGTGHDGAHIVVVYVQDKGGTWSVAADFSPETSGN